MCGETISMTASSITRAVCAICQYSLDTGKPLPEEFLTQYRLSKAGVQDVSLVVLREEKKIAEGMQAKTKFSLRSMGGNLLAATGLSGVKKRPVTPKKTLQLTDQKQRQPLFSSMEEIDQQLKPKL